MFLDYEPPSARMRLRDGDGKELRINAEKSTLINEFLVDLFTPPGGVVWDMYAGSGSMAVACIKTDRYYVGTEIDNEIVIWATTYREGVDAERTWSNARGSSLRKTF